MNHILTLDPPPPDLGIAALPRLSLATCLTCLAPLDPLSYKHGTDGTAVSHSSGRVIAPEVRIASLIETTVTLAILDKRWRWQGWTDSENLNRLGGFGAWVQDAHYPPCPDCGEQMTHLLQLNVEGQLPATDGSHLHLADGLCYIYWCDRCAISTYLLQYT